MLSIERVKKRQWILTTGWDETLLEEHRLPNRCDLDPVFPENPVWIRRSSRCYADREDISLTKIFDIIRCGPTLPS